MLSLLALWIGMSAQAQVSPFMNCFVSDAAGNQIPCARAADETDGNPHEKCDMSCNCTDGHGGCVIPVGTPSKPEPVDVPAVQETRTYKTGDISCEPAPECKGKDWTCNIAVCKSETATETVTTCKDKTRVLWHDESNPPKFWCHRVQSQ